MSEISNQDGFIAAIKAAGKASDNFVVDYFQFIRESADAPTIDATAAAPLAALTDEIATLLAAAPLNATDTALLREKTALLVRAAHGEPRFPTDHMVVEGMLDGSENYAGHAAVLLVNRDAIEHATADNPASVIDSWCPDTP